MKKTTFSGQKRSTGSVRKVAKTPRKVVKKIAAKKSTTGTKWVGPKKR